MCSVLGVHRSGYYAWMKNPLSSKAKEDLRLTNLICHFYKESDSSYGSPRIFKDLREQGETCGENRVARLMNVAGIKAVRGYKKRKYHYTKPSEAYPNRLEQQFEYEQPDQAWVTDITQLRTLEGWLYLAVVIDLYSRMVIGWSMKPTIHRDIVLDALLMAVWRRKPKQRVIIHSDQGSQFGSDDWARFMKEHNLQASMSRRGNCYDNAVAESFFSSLKKEKTRRKSYRTRDELRADIFDYIEVFYNRRRRHSYLGHISPEQFELERCGNT
jgi:putative transposase